MSPAVAGVRNHLFVQAALTLLFGLIRPGSTAAWTVGTVALALAAVGLGAALKPTLTMRTAVLGFEGVALAFGVIGLTQGHYVPGTIIGVHLLVKLFQTSPDEFVAAAPAPVMAAPPGPSAPPAPPGPWAVPAQDTAQDSAQDTAQDSAPWAAPAPAGWPAPAAAPVHAVAPVAPEAVAAAAPQVALAPVQAPPPPFLPPQPGAHPGGRTVVPLVPQQAVPQQAVSVPVTQRVAAVPAPPAAVAEPPSALEQAARTLVEPVAAVSAPVSAPVPAPVPAPEPPPAVAPPTTAPQCMTILPG